MADANLEVVRRAYDAYARRSIVDLQKLTDADCVIQTVVEGRAEPRPFRGLDGIREWIENENSVWASVSIEDLELEDLGGDRVFTSATAHVRGRESGIDLKMPVWSVFDLRSGRISRLQSFPSRADALAAAE